MQITETNKNKTMAGIGGYKKKTKGNRGYKMTGSPFPKKAGPEANRTLGSGKAQQEFEDRESAIENAVNNYWPSADTKEFTPSEKQIAIELKKIKEEKKS
tara:strand:+ start:191 stop:490 length:300 start_codon:yes stop_codon:yes gene_type:complete